MFQLDMINVLSYTIRLRIAPEIKSTIATIITKPIKMIPTRSQDRVCKAKINGVPIPPAPINPKIDAERKLSSKRYRINDKMTVIFVV